MSSDAKLLEMSLGEIISKNRGGFRKGGKRPPVGKKKPGGVQNKKNAVQTGRISKPNAKKAIVKTKARKPGGGAPIVDARLKIIQKTRSKIGDARDRLNQKMRQTDARSRITPRSEVRVGRPTLVSKPRPLMESMPRRTLDLPRLGESGRYRSTGASFLPGSGSVSRTIRNGANRPSILRGGSAYMDRERDRDEPMHDWGNRMHSLPRLEILVPTVREREPLLHRSHAHMDSESNSWHRPSKTIPNVVYRSSARDYLPKSQTSRSQEGYRIVVSNLQDSVTHEDIKELFEDVGTLIGSRVVRKGTAEVVYKNLEDAIAAVDTYHNRQLDGQPMKCLLVKSSSGHSKGGKDILPDISTVHHALFTK